MNLFGEVLERLPVVLALLAVAVGLRDLLRHRSGRNRRRLFTRPRDDRGEWLRGGNIRRVLK